MTCFLSCVLGRTVFFEKLVGGGAVKDSAQLKGSGCFVLNFVEGTSVLTGSFSAVMRTEVPGGNGPKQLS